MAEYLHDTKSKARDKLMVKLSMDYRNQKHIKSCHEEECPIKAQGEGKVEDLEVRIEISARKQAELDRKAELIRKKKAEIAREEAAKKRSLYQQLDEAAKKRKEEKEQAMKKHNIVDVKNLSTSEKMKFRMQSKLIADVKAKQKELQATVAKKFTEFNIIDRLKVCDKEGIESIITKGDPEIRFQLEIMENDTIEFLNNLLDETHQKIEKSKAVDAIGT